MASANSSKTTSTGTALAASQGTSNVPDFMRDDARMGKENIQADDLIIPRVALTAAISPAVVDGLCEAGHFFHAVTEEDLGPEMRIVPILHQRRYTLWKPRWQGGGILARSSNGKTWDVPDQTFDDIQPDKARPKYKVTWETGREVGRDIGLGRWGTSDPNNEDSAPAATLAHVLLCVNLDDLAMGPFAIFLQRSAEPVGKQLLTKIDLDRAPIFGQVYKMGAKNAKNAAGDDFFQYTFTKDGYVDADTYSKLKELHEQYSKGAFKVDDSTDIDADEGSKGGGEKKAAEAAAKEDRY